MEGKVGRSSILIYILAAIFLMVLIPTVFPAAPTVASANLTPAIPVNTDDLNCTNGSVSDGDSDSVTLHYNWFMNGTSTALLNLPMYNSSDSDISNFNNSVTIGNTSQSNNTPAFNGTGGKIGGAFVFNSTLDGFGDYINVTHHARLLFAENQSFTIEVWINRTANTSLTDRDMVILDKTQHVSISAESAVNGFLLWVSSVKGGSGNRGAVRFYYGNATEANNLDPLQGTKNLRDDKYHHIAVVRNISSINNVGGINKTLSLYVDGVLEDNQVDSINGTIGNSSSDLIIGALYSEAVPGIYQGWNGSIDELIIWNRTLSFSEILLHNASNYSVLAHQETGRLDVWQCLIVPIDSTGVNGSPVFSGNVTITRINRTVTLTTTQNDNTSRSFFGPSETVRIRINISAGTTNYPKATIRWPNGTIAVNQTAMINETRAGQTDQIFFADYTPLNITGYYDVDIHEDVDTSRRYENAFYVGRVWLDGYDNATFLYRRHINVSEPNQLNRSYEPVDAFVAFTSNALNSSIRVSLFNGTHYIEVPSQTYNLTQTAAGAVSRGNVVFLTSLSLNRNQSYYVAWRSTSITAVSYDTDHNFTNLSNLYYVRTKFYNVTLNRSFGGLLQDAVDLIGNNTNIGGASPMQFAPEARIPTPVFAIRDYSTPNVTVDNGSVFTRLNVRGLFGGDAEKPYDLNFTFYSNNPYFRFTKNITTEEAGTWTSYDSELLKLKDGAFSDFRFKNGSVIFSGRYQNGTNSGNDQSGISINLSWIAVYNNQTRDGIGDVFISRRNAFETSPRINFFDINTDDEYQRTVISSSTSVTANSSFYEEIARAIYDGILEFGFISDLDTQLDNPVNFSVGSQEAFDTTLPRADSFGVTPSSPTDQQNVTCHSAWTDGVELQKVIIEENTSFSLVNTTVTLTGTTNTSGNLTINSSVLETGTFGCRFYGFDAADNVNVTSLVVFTVSDLTPPVILNITTVPNSSDGLDPNVSVNVTVNITDFGTRDTVILGYKEWNASGAFTNVTMTRLGTSDFWRANFTPTTSNNWTIRITANDTSGNTNTSSDQNVSAFTDFTWTSVPGDFGSMNVGLGSNLTVGLITINNTGDVSFDFTITHNLPEPPVRVFLNNTATSVTTTLSAGQAKQINVTGVGASTERDDKVTITIDATNASASPSLNTSNVTLISFESGAFLFVEIIDYPATVTQGDTGKKLSAKLTNKGNETATNTTFAWILPSGWSTSDALNITVAGNGNLTVDNSTYHNITVNIGSSASTGSQSVISMATCCNDSTKTQSKTQTIAVAAASTTTTTTTSEGGGGGGGGTALTPEREQRLFRTEERFELTRGLNNTFVITIENPFEGTFENITINVSGFIANRIRLSRTFIPILEKNQSVNLTVFIEAPEYLPLGETVLTFAIKGVAKKGLIRSDITTEKTVKLLILGISEGDALKIEEGIKRVLETMKARGFNAKEIDGIHKQIVLFIEERRFDSLGDLQQIVDSIYESASVAFSELQLIQSIIQNAESNGLPTQRTARLLNLAGLAFERGDFSLAKSRADEALFTFGLETKGEFNVAAFLIRNWLLVSVASIAGIGIFSVGYYKARIYLIRKGLKGVGKEQNIVKGLMQQVQKECFEEGKLSMEEYENSMQYYQNQISNLIQKKVRLESQKTNVMRLSKIKALRLEREKLIELMKQAQKEYLEEGKMETIAYAHMMSSIDKRLVVVEEELTVNEVQATLKGNNVVFKFFRASKSGKSNGATGVKKLDTKGVDGK